MAKFSALTQIGLLLILIFWTTGSTDAAFSIEEEILQLKLKVTQLEAKNDQMEEKDAKMQEKVEKKITELETRNGQLETKLKEQETILISLLLKINYKPATGSKSILNNWETAIQSTAGKSGTPRTCKELQATDPSLPSGMQWIDPDGQDFGDGPIYVFCDMTTGSTSIVHDSERPIDVGHCAEPGCYSRSINYSNASMKQIESLITLSAECHQKIKYDCYFAPFELNNVAYAWWNDRNGNTQYFWAGNNTEGIHTCQCGIGENCVDKLLKCNCDSAAPIQLADDGVITDKNVLPITRLNFGRTQSDTSSGIHTLGRFECTGSVAALPTSCEDLWLIGHSLSGFYSVMGPAKMESIFCDFAKLPGDAGFEKRIGFIDVKSAPVYFYVQRRSSFITVNIPIPFDLAILNEGNAMDLTTGTFTAPRNGVYFFSFTGLSDFPASQTWLALNIYICVNGVRIGTGRAEDGNTVANQNTAVTVLSTFNLKIGDQVWLTMAISTGVFLMDDSNHFTHFTGFLLEEDIVASL